MKVQNPQDRITLWIVWVLASTAGILLGFVMCYLFVALAKALFTGVNEDRLFGAIMWPALALMLTFTQWLIVRRRFVESGWWFVASIAGWSASIVSILVFGKLLTNQWGLMVQPGFAQRTILVTYFGCLLGAAQWIYFRRQLDSGAFWILGSSLGYALLSVAIGKSITNLTEMALTGAVPAAVTGLVLILLNPRQGRSLSVD